MAETAVSVAPGNGVGVTRDGQDVDFVRRKKQNQSSQKTKPVVAKPEVDKNLRRQNNDFATTKKDGGKFATGNLDGYGDEGAVPYRDVDTGEWRIIFRMLPPKKDGSQTISFYYKGRTSYVNKDGKRIVPYLKGDKVTRNGTERELHAHKSNNRKAD